MGIISPPTSTSTSTCTSAPDEEIVMPKILLWNPYIIYPHIVKPGSVKCVNCGSIMHHGYWNDGTSHAKQPRILHGLDNIVVLVSAVYVCGNRHKILAHDPAILELFPSNSIPFILLHKTGFTKELVDTSIALCKRGINFYRLESLILERRWEVYAQQQRLHASLSGLQSPDTCSDAFLTSIISKSPSNDILSKMFLTQFLKDEKIYLQEILKIPSSESLSFDHTFKVAANIGYLREDGKWISEYDGLFLVLNDQGHILTWQLTKGTSFADVKTLLEDLCKRSLSCQQQIKTIYIDDCCKLRAKIKAVFGDNVSVKLDLFHAVQRITKTLKKKLIITSRCMQELRLVFRRDGDSGETRLSNTPSPEIILEKLDAFISKWRDVSHNGVKIFKPDTFKALNNLKHHISAGCLSNIPPGRGTNRNERFHEHINSFFNRSRIGILLAYALITVITHAHNTSKQIAGGKILTQPISTCSLKDVPPHTFIGIMPKERARQKELHDVDHWERDAAEHEMNIDVVFSVYLKALEKLKVKRGLDEMKLTTLTNEIQHFEEYHPFRTDSNNFDSLAGSAELEKKLSEYGFKVSPSSKDGNCFFRAVSLGIMARNDKEILMKIVSGSEDLDLEALQMKLRLAFVNELIGEHRHVYEEFLSDNANYDTEANRFLQDGFYANSLGDLMPLAVATILQTVLVIIPADSPSSPLYVTPPLSLPGRMIFLIYTPSGPGHYDAAIPYSLTLENAGTIHDTTLQKQVCYFDGSALTLHRSSRSRLRLP